MKQSHLMRTWGAVLALAIAGSCDFGSYDPDGPLDPLSAPPIGGNGEVVEVVIQNLSFDPGEIRIAAGTTVRWRMLDTGTFHFVAEGTPSDGSSDFKSPALNTGDTWERVFGEPGTYVYYCSNHSTVMRNAMVVVE